MKQNKHQLEHLPTLLVQQIRLQWYKDCRGGNAAAQRNQYPRAMRLPKDFFSYYPFGLPTHFASIIQRPDGFQIDRDCRRLMEWKPNGTIRLHPFELIQQEPGIHVRYRNDWHIGAIPERYTYDKTGQKQPLNELALDLIPGDYGRAVCNGRFRDWDTGVWYYVLDILNVMPLAEPTDALTSFTDREPNKIYTRSIGCGDEKQEDTTMIKERIPISGDLGSKVKQLMEYAGWYEGRSVDISIAEQYYADHGVPMMKTTQRLYRKYFGLCCEWYLAQKKLKWAADFEFALFPYLVNGIKNHLEDAYFRDMSGCELAEIEQAAGEKCQPIGHIGYYYPAEVWISEYGKLYAKYEYQDEIECFPDVFALIERELRQCKFDSAAMKTVEALDNKL